MKILATLFLGILPYLVSGTGNSADNPRQFSNYPEDPVSRKADTVQVSVYESNWDQKQIFAYLGEPRAMISDSELAEKLRGINYAIPCSGKVWRGFGKGHKGVDIDLNVGDPVSAAFDGKVRYAMYNKGGFGNLVIVRHPNGLETWYAHLSKIKVKPDDVVSAGQVIGLGGSTGRSRSPHLHLEFRYRDVPLDLQKFMDIENKMLKPIVSTGFYPVEMPAMPLLSESDLRPAGSDTVEVKSTVEIVNEIVEAQEVWHKIRSGDNLSKIASKYRTSVSSICKMNKITPKTVLKIGRNLRIR